MGRSRTGPASVQEPLVTPSLSSTSPTPDPFPVAAPVPAPDNSSSDDEDDEPLVTPSLSSTSTSPTPDPFPVAAPVPAPDNSSSDDEDDEPLTTRVSREPIMKLATRMRKSDVSSGDDDEPLTRTNIREVNNTISAASTAAPSPTGPPPTGPPPTGPPPTGPPSYDSYDDNNSNGDNDEKEKRYAPPQPPKKKQKKIQPTTALSRRKYHTRREGISNDPDATFFSQTKFHHLIRGRIVEGPDRLPVMAQSSHFHKGAMFEPIKVFFSDNGETVPPDQDFFLFRRIDDRKSETPTWFGQTGVSTSVEFTIPMGQPHIAPHHGNIVHQDFVGSIEFSIGCGVSPVKQTRRGHLDYVLYMLPIGRGNDIFELVHGHIDHVMDPPGHPHYTDNPIWQHNNFTSILNFDLIHTHHMRYARGAYAEKSAVLEARDNHPVQYLINAVAKHFSCNITLIRLSNVDNVNVPGHTSFSSWKRKHVMRVSDVFFDGVSEDVSKSRVNTTKAVKHYREVFLIYYEERLGIMSFYTNVNWRDHANETTHLGGSTVSQILSESSDGDIPLVFDIMYGSKTCNIQSIEVPMMVNDENHLTLSGFVLL